jgi:hypothetical protein
MLLVASYLRFRTNNERGGCGCRGFERSEPVPAPGGGGSWGPDHHGRTTKSLFCKPFSYSGDA